MTDEERQRLNELGRIMAFNNSTDQGRSLTEEEAQEHSALFWKALREWIEEKGGLIDEG